MVEGQAVTAEERAALRAQLHATQAGAEAPYRLALAWVARRADSHARARGVPVEAVTGAALRLLHALRHTYDPSRDPVAWVDSLIAHAARRLALPRGMANAGARSCRPGRAIQGRNRS